MKFNRFVLMCLFGIIAFLLSPASLSANKSTVSIEAPASAAAGSTITIKLHVVHKGNSGLHRTNWVSLKINGEEVKRWTFTRKERPESENFTLEYTQTVDSSVEIVAQANCNIHGSEGPVSHKVDVK